MARAAAAHEVVQRRDDEPRLSSDAPSQPQRTWEWLILAVPITLTVGAWLVLAGNRTPGTAAALHGFPLDDARIQLPHLTVIHSVRAPHYTICDGPQNLVAVYALAQGRNT